MVKAYLYITGQGEFDDIKTIAQFSGSTFAQDEVVLEFNGNKIPCYPVIQLNWELLERAKKDFNINCLVLYAKNGSGLRELKPIKKGKRTSPHWHGNPVKI